jgi:hypothetical protein
MGRTNFCAHLNEYVAARLRANREYLHNKLVAQGLDADQIEAESDTLRESHEVTLRAFAVMVQEIFAGDEPTVIYRGDWQGDS